ncbi:MAG: cyclic-di-AMP receptor [Oscillospiraceae bacterium]|jgi:uncharacterized protein YaaQ|nr:cyclic-di-AMP receptor [Oscillospiraceae bacterium]
MKLLLSIINHDDAHDVIRHLTQEGYPVTKLATTGGFLQVGNVTVLIVTEDEKVKGALDVIEKHSHSRRQVAVTPEAGMGQYSSLPVDITVGGATVFVLNVEDLRKF